jgi:hypothetical protein
VLTYECLQLSATNYCSGLKGGQDPLQASSHKYEVDLLSATLATSMLCAALTCSSLAACSLLHADASKSHSCTCRGDMDVHAFEGLEHSMWATQSGCMNNELQCITFINAGLLIMRQEACCIAFI